MSIAQHFHKLWGVGYIDQLRWETYIRYATGPKLPIVQIIVSHEIITMGVHPKGRKLQIYNIYTDNSLAAISNSVTQFLIPKYKWRILLNFPRTEPNVVEYIYCPVLLAIGNLSYYGTVGCASWYSRIPIGQLESWTDHRPISAPRATCQYHSTTGTHTVLIMLIFDIISLFGQWNSSQ